MSFPKAKLQRFNEIQNSTPSPADYNVAVKSHVSGAIIPKSERFAAELRSPASSENGSFVSTGAPPTFRTPNPPRRLKSQVGANRKIKSVELFQSADDLEALKEKIVECNNKDLFIQDQTEQIDDMKQQLSDLESRLAELNVSKLQLENTVEKLNGDLETSIKELQTKHQRDLAELSETISDLNDKMELMKEEYNKLKEENNRDLTEMLKDIEKLEKLHEALTSAYKIFMEQKTKEVEDKDRQIHEFKENYDQLKGKHSKQLNEVTKKHQVEVQDIEYEMLKTVTEVQNQLEKERQNHDKLFKEARVQFEEEKMKLTMDFEAMIKQREENHKETSMLVEIQMKEKCNEIETTWELKLQQAKDEHDAILKECQAIAEYNVIECEVEKNKALYQLSELKDDFEHIKTERDVLQNKCKDLQTELSSIIVELNNVREQSAQEAKTYKETIEQTTKDKNMYEITISKTHMTIEALKRRLMNSDKDVEQLKAELEATEVSKLEVEGKCNQLMDELLIITDLCDNFEGQNEYALKIANEKVATLERDLLDKVEYFKQESLKQVVGVTEELSKTKKELTDAMEHLCEQQKLNSKAQFLISTSQKEIENLETLSSSYTVKISHLEAAFDNVQEALAASSKKVITLEEKNTALNDENKKLKTVIEFMQTSEDDLVKQLETLKEQCSRYEAYKTKATEYEKEAEEAAEYRKKYIDISGKYDLLVQKLEKLESENEQLLKKIAVQEALIGPFREHLEAYEMEYNALMNQKRNAEQEAQEMGMKYAQILGHQNQKQKIKHLMDLKRKNYDLFQSNKELENKIRAQSRTIEKLKKEISTVKSPKKLLPQQIDNKENISSPNRTLNSSRIDSPSGVLRDRN